MVAVDMTLVMALEVEEEEVVMVAVVALEEGTIAAMVPMVDWAAKKVVVIVQVVGLVEATPVGMVQAEVGLAAGMMMAMVPVVDRVELAEGLALVRGVLVEEVGLDLDLDQAQAQGMVGVGVGMGVGVEEYNAHFRGSWFGPGHSDSVSTVDKALMLLQARTNCISDIVQMGYLIGWRRIRINFPPINI